MKNAPPIVVAALGVLVSAASANAMTGYRWKHRPVVVFADREANPALIEQRRIFSGSRAGLIERDIVLVWVVGDSVRTELGPGPGLAASQHRSRFGVAGSGFRVFLVGKDGGTKLAQSEPLRAGVLFGTIDAMPMRRDEMGRQR